MFLSILQNAEQKYKLSKANSPLKLLLSSNTWKRHY
jgi:hypothetical protein